MPSRRRSSTGARSETDKLVDDRQPRRITQRRMPRGPLVQWYDPPIDRMCFTLWILSQLLLTNLLCPHLLDPTVRRVICAERRGVRASGDWPG